jgi:thiol-disulfide isomerase/thioredoxin
MMKRVLSAALLLILVSLLLITGCANETTNETTTATRGPQVGSLAPEFNLVNLEGNYISLDSFRGKPVLLNFWATWCSPCRIEMPYLQRIYDEWTDKGLVLLTVNIGESITVAKNFMQENGFTMPVLLDSSRVTLDRYQITGIPTTYFIDKDGIIQGKRVGSFTNKETIEQSLTKIMP